MPKPVDRVQLTKQESAAGGGDAADSSDFLNLTNLEPNEDAPEMQGVFLQAPSPATTSDENVYISRDSSGNMIFRDDVDATERTLSDLLAGVGGGISEAQHEALDTLVHNIAETSYTEVNRTGNQVDSIIIWTSVAKTTKIREEVYTYTGNKVTTIVTKQYDGAGSLVQTLTETLTYTGGNVDNITATLT